MRHPIVALGPIRRPKRSLRAWGQPPLSGPPTTCPGRTNSRLATPAARTLLRIMAFPRKVAEDLLVACQRHCCLCHKPCGVKIEVHHIVPVERGGDDSANNAIALCFDCHAEVEHYNTKHPRGRRYTASELRQRRDHHLELVRSRLGPPRPIISAALGSTTLAAVIDQLETLELWRPELSERVLPQVLQLAAAERSALVDRLGDLLAGAEERVRWNVGRVVELLVDWDPQLVSDDLLLRLAADDFFSVRSSAAVAYYSLARSAPNRVPVQTLGRLASYDEDWYVMTPATSALIRLARTRPVAMDVLAGDLEAEDRDTRRHAAEALRRIGLEHPAALRTDIADRLQASSDRKLRELGKDWSARLEARRSREKTPLDSYMF